MPAVVADAAVELLGRMASGDASRISTDVERLLGHPPRDFAQFVSDFGAAFR